VDDNRQIYGSINGGPNQTISTFKYPLGLQYEDVFGPTKPTYTTWSPDGKHLATLVAVTVPESIYSYPYVVNTITRATTRVHLPSNMEMRSPSYMEWARERSLAWANNNTLLIFGVTPAPLEIGGTAASQTTSYSYNIATNTLTPLPGVTTALQGVVRCYTLFVFEMSAMTQFELCESFVNPQYWYVGSADLRRYTLIGNHFIGQPISLGTTAACPDYFAGGQEAMGWDVSATGQSLVYQQLNVQPGPIVNPNLQLVNLQTTSQFEVAPLTVAGAGPATQILIGAVSNFNAMIAIAPNQKMVAVVATDQLDDSSPSNPSVYAGPTGGSAISTYTPGAGGLPAWYSDSAGFDTSALWSELPSNPNTNLLQWKLSMSTFTGQIAGGHHPASLP
jgi:hypothetical protein